MDFEDISKMAYQREFLTDKATTLEQLVWYKCLDIYQNYSQGIFSLEESKNMKNQLKAYYVNKKRVDNFYKELNEERYKNIRESEDMLIDILKAEEKKVPEKELTKMLIEYVTKITGIIPIKTKYNENYEVN